MKGFCRYNEGPKSVALRERDIALGEPGLIGCVLERTGLSLNRNPQKCEKDFTQERFTIASLKMEGPCGKECRSL